MKNYDLNIKQRNNITKVEDYLRFSITLHTRFEILINDLHPVLIVKKEIF